MAARTSETETVNKPWFRKIVSGGFNRKRRIGLAIVLGMATGAQGADLLPTLTAEDESPATNAAPAAVPVSDSGTGKAEAAVKKAPVNPAADFDELDVATAREKAIAFFRTLSTNEKADGLICPPLRLRMVLEWKTEQVRCTKRLVNEKVPVYQMVEQVRDVKEGDSVTAVTVRKKVRVGKVVGWKTNQVERTFPDPKGSIVEERRVPVMGPGGPDEWSTFQFGHNAMALYALMRAGVDPSDEMVQRAAEQLLKIYQTFGIPDYTWDLAWSVAAFSMIDAKEYQDMARRMAGKLLDGQIGDGAAKGLWGPICINTELLAAMMVKRQEYSTFYLSAKKKYTEQKRASDQEKMDQALEALRTFEGLMKQVVMLAPLINSQGFFVALRDETGAIPPFTLPLYTSYIYNQVSADMDSTAIAMFGLRVAAARKVLPAETWRPELAPRRPITKPRKASEVVQQAMVAVAGAQTKEGWSELNQHQPVRDFDKQKGIEGVPANAKAFNPIEAKTTMTSTLQGYAVVSAYGAIAGPGQLRQYGRNVVSGNALVKAVLKSGLNTVDGGFVPPYDACFYLSEPVDLGSPEYDLGQREALCKFLVARQNANGSWGKPGSVDMSPSSLRERLKTLPAVRWNKVETGYGRSGPHVNFTAKEALIEGQHHWRRTLSCPRQIVSTAYALLALSAENESSSAPGGARP